MKWLLFIPKPNPFPTMDYENGIKYLRNLFYKRKWGGSSEKMRLLGYLEDVQIFTTISSRWDVDFDEYDGVLFADFLNMRKQARYIEPLRKKMADRPIIALWHPVNWISNPTLKKIEGYKSLQREVNMVDLILLDSWMPAGPRLWNELFGCNKFLYHDYYYPLSIIRPFHKQKGEKNNCVYSTAPTNYWTSIRHCNEVVKLFRRRHPSFNAYITNTTKQNMVDQYSIIQKVPWLEHYEMIGDSKVGLMNSIGGLCSVAAFGAIVGTPFVGSNRSVAVKENFSDLVRPLEDYGGQAGLLSRLVTDDDFYREVIDKAWERQKKLCLPSYATERFKKLVEERL